MAKVEHELQPDNLEPQTAIGETLMGEPYYSVDIPGFGELWCTDKSYLSWWLHKAADKLDEREFDEDKRES